MENQMRVIYIILKLLLNRFLIPMKFSNFDF